MSKQLNRIIVKGGVLSLGELKYICESVESLGLKTISFGSRQDILLPKNVNQEELAQFEKLKVVAAKEIGVENIVSSYVSADIFSSTSWLTGDKYLYILEQFRSKSKLKINIADPKQRLVPLFTGHVNFIASEQEDYWYLYVRLPDWKKTQMYPALIYSWDLDKVETAIENILQEEPETIETIFELVSDAVDTNNRTVDKPLKVPKISITPWKSFIVKGIPIESKLIWEKFLGKRGINVRHSMLELNWHLPVANKDALNLKKYLVSNFDQNDISTYGLTFGITDYNKASYYFTSIVVEKNKQPEMIGNFKTRDTYNLLYAKNL